MKKSLGVKLALLAKSQGKSQAEIADQIGMAPAQLNRFFKGNADCNTEKLLLILNILDINLEGIIFRKTRKHIETDEIENVFDCITYMFKSIDELGQQTYLNQLAWATKATTKKALPAKVQAIIEKETNLI